MRFLFVFGLFLISSVVLMAQTVPSDCTAPNSVLEAYQSDADRLALRRGFAEQWTYVDSTTIPTASSDTLLDALIAVYNATELPARDSVIDIFNLHTFPQISMRFLLLSGDTTASWMQNLENSGIPTGNTDVDSLINLYNLSVYSFHDYGGTFWYNTVVFQTASNLNIEALAGLFEPIPGVVYADPDGAIGDGSDIQASILPDYVELNYIYKWGDCPSGCICSHTWTFRVYYDCSVEYIGSSGCPIEGSPTGGLHDIGIETYKPYPNPFSHSIQLSGLEKDVAYQIYTVEGRVVRSGTTREQKISGLNALPGGTYFLKLLSGSSHATLKIIKQ